MDKNLRNQLVKLIKEVLSEAPAPTIEPPPRPTEKPPTPSKPDKRPNPLRLPKPDIAPRPKALSHDVEAFLNQRKGLTEKIDTGDDMPDLIDPSKRAKIENEKDYVEQILPDLGPAADRYLEIITSESYQSNITEVANTLGISVSEIQNKFPNYPTMVMLAIKALNDIKRAESGMKQQLEQIAVDVVLDLPENKFIKQYVEDGNIIIDVKLGNADLTKAVTADKMDEEMDNGLTVAENLNIQLNKDLGEGKLRRTLANYMTQGDAVNKLYLFKLVSDKLGALSPNLSKKYGILTAITQIGYYMTPDFPIMAGPALDKRFRKLIPVEKIELLPIIKQLFYDKKVTPIYKIKEILLGEPNAQIYMNQLITQAEELM